MTDSTDTQPPSIRMGRDGVRYILKPKSAEQAPAVTPQPPGTTAEVIGNDSADDLDAQLPDESGATTRGGQVGHESKRGAY